MLLVRTEVKSSDISGLGLYTKEYIKYGELVEMVDDLFYKIFTQEEIDKFKEGSVQKQFEHDYMFKQGDLYFCSIDNARFGNHSDDPNCIWIGVHKDRQRTVGGRLMYGYFAASRDIKPGEELTFNYKTFCEKGCDW